MLARRGRRPRRRVRGRAMSKPEEQTPPPKRKRGRPPQGPQRAIRLSDDHWGKAKALGGGKYTDGIREALDFTCEAKGVVVGKAKDTRKPKTKGDPTCTE